MAAVTVEKLYDGVSRVRGEPNLPHSESQALSLDDLRQTMGDTRSALIAAVEDAPDTSFGMQPANEAGEEVWSVGEILGHCNESIINIGSSALALLGVDTPMFSDALRSNTESKEMTREEALAAANAFDANSFFSSIPDDERLENTSEHNFFGTMSARAWLYFMAMHESDHVYQIRSLG